MHGVNLTLEGPKPLFDTKTSLENLDNAIRISAEGGWLRMLSVEAGLEDLMHVKSWDGLKRWVAEHWGVVVDAAVRRLGEEIRRVECAEGQAERRQGGKGGYSARPSAYPG